jgi:hypothetical protein
MWPFRTLKINLPSFQDKNAKIQQHKKRAFHNRTIARGRGCVPPEKIGVVKKRVGSIVSISSLIAKSRLKHNNLQKIFHRAPPPDPCLACHS